jgi:hypothetical protein
MTYEEWLVKANRTYGPHTEQRYGQWLYNSLHSIRDDIALGVVGTSLDPFYRDDIVPAFLCEVARRW